MVSDMSQLIEWVKLAENKPSGNVLVFYKNDHGRGRIVKARWVHKFSEEIDDCDELEGELDCNGYAYWPEGWYEQIDNWGDFTSVAITEGQVTHWMPLPEFPEP